MELLRLGIDILVSVGKNFIFRLQEIDGSKYFFPLPVDFPDYGSSIGRKWGEE
jgi:hypothetical protein